MADTNSNQEIKKQLKDMTVEELIKAFKIGSQYVTNRMQVAGTGRNGLGELYGHSEFLAGLTRLEKVEDELNLRGVAYG